MLYDIVFDLGFEGRCVFPFHLGLRVSTSWEMEKNCEYDAGSYYIASAHFYVSAWEKMHCYMGKVLVLWKLMSFKLKYTFNENSEAVYIRNS